MTIVYFKETFLINFNILNAISAYDFIKLSKDNVIVIFIITVLHIFNII
jgi:hypothetical protein